MSHKIVFLVGLSQKFFLRPTKRTNREQQLKIATKIYNVGVQATGNAWWRKMSFYPGKLEDIPVGRL